MSAYISEPELQQSCSQIYVAQLMLRGAAFDGCCARLCLPVQSEVNKLLCNNNAQTC